MTKWTEAQLNAINISGSNIIVSAGAGSGKTAVLTTRVIEKVKQGININELLVLTFTKAAAREMKERIREALRKEGLQEQLLLLDASYITTFDSFALSLVKKYHYILNISKDISISPDSLIQTIIINEVNTIFEKSYLDKNDAFLQLISDFCVKDDENIKKAIINLFTKLDQKVDKLSYLNTYFDKVFTENNISKNVKRYQEIIKDKIITIIPLFKNLLSEACDNCYPDINALMENLINARNYDDIKVIINSWELPRKRKECGENYSLYRKDLVDEFKKLESYLRYDNENEMVEEVKRTNIYQKAIISLLIELENNVKQYKNENSLYTFYDIAKMAISLVKDNEEIRISTKNSFKEIMIDEYQDTSDIQEEFINLISNNNVYMVGDIKQSIYRFRNANPSLFKSKYDNYEDVKKAYKGKGIKIDLLENFRSRSEVLTAVNDIFAVVMSDQIGGADYKSRHKMIAGNKVYDNMKDANINYQIEVLNYGELNADYTKTEREAFTIAYDILDKLQKSILVYDKETKTMRKVQLSDFAILIDRGTDFDIYKQIFEYMGLPLNIFKDENLNEGYDLLILKNIMKFIYKIKNQEYDIEYKYLFTSIARSFLFSIDDDQIHSYLMNNDIYQSEIYKIASQIADRLDNLNTNEFIQLIINDFHYLDNITLVGNVDNVFQKIDYLLTLANSLTDANLTILDFISHLDEVISANIDIKYSLNIGDSDAIKLMTIHKSKGLEFPICYYAGLSTKFNTNDIKEQFIFDNELGIITPYFENGIQDTIYKDIFKYYYNYEEISERIRLFYVALTRAKEKIILVDNLNVYKEAEVCDSYKLRYQSFKNIVDSIYNNLQYTETSVNNELCLLTDAYKAVKISNYHDTLNQGEIIATIDIKKFIDYTEDNKTKDTKFSKGINILISQDEYEKMQFGTKIHHILEMLDFSSPNIIEDIKEIDIDDFYKEKLITFIHTLTSKKLSTAKVYKEFEFIDGDRHGIIDLMFEYPDYIDIIDYKLKNIDDAAYLLQLKGYEHYIYQRTNKKVNTYLYSIIDGKFQKV